MTAPLIPHLTTSVGSRHCSVAVHIKRDRRTCLHVLTCHGTILFPLMNSAMIDPLSHRFFLPPLSSRTVPLCHCVQELRAGEHPAPTGNCFTGIPRPGPSVLGADSSSRLVSSSLAPPSTLRLSPRLANSSAAPLACTPSLARFAASSTTEQFPNPTPPPPTHTRARTQG
ncbi:hypothetical protein BCV69DRAFT_152295 [Microstroma glucosiphilum]|uniref:Uncharacterized protein n=1 Tax=Pseudomicrostroma glucosiphilum TaxID=1684307 RepID=A0A316UB65_9BASI|nr:hypothetical protein BCV69DRAFT_152295 [Pseudomicrostroma glucosiphilum]PWN21691.1 hypothetical protein BCV69DRAFT_152295 [Pseudomicrostroma glucosiphilum]